MITQTVALVLVMVALKGAVLFAVARFPGPLPRGPAPLQVMAVCEMFLIAFFAPKLMTFGVTSNIGNICYATVVTTQLLILQRHGPEAALDTVRLVLFALTIGLGQAALIAAFPSVPGNETWAGAVDRIALNSLVVVAASYAAFAAGQYLLIALYPHVRHWTPAASCLALIIVVQALDSFVFFSVAFAGAAWTDRFEMMMAGFFIKVGIGALMLPVLLCGPAPVSAAMRRRL